MHSLLHSWLLGFWSRNVWVGIVVLSTSVASADESSKSALKWRALSPLPDREGFAGMMGGAYNDKLLVAGGANFTDKRPWEGGVKRWYDAVWMLDAPDGSWRRVGNLPRASAYGLAVSTPNGVICAGGGDATSNFADVFRMSYDEGRFQVESLPPLPQPCSFASGALVGNTFYISGGIDRPDATSCLRTLWSLDTRQPSQGWKVLEPCPGAERMLAVAAASDDTFYLFSGTRLSAGADGKPVREYLHDAWCYRPSYGWQRLPDLPRPAVAAPSPAPRLADGTLVIASGDDGSRVGFKPETEHPGFPRDVLMFDPRSSLWTNAGPSPFSRATAPVIAWRDWFVIASGEERPGYRSPANWALQRD